MNLNSGRGTAFPRILFIVFLTGLLLLSLPPLILLAAPKRLRDYGYRELAYRVIVEEATRDAADEFEIVDALFRFVSEHETGIARAGPVDATVLDDLVRGIGFCDQQSWGLGTLLATKGIPAVMLMLRGHDAISHHSVTSVYLAGKWRIVDPLYDLVFFTGPKEPASFEDLARADRRMTLTSPKRAAIDRNDPAFLERYFALFEPAHAPVRWHPDTKDAKRRGVSAIVNLYFRLGNSFAYRFQDAWLDRQEFETPDAGLFVRARHYDLFSRRDLAMASYQRLIATYPHSAYAEDGLYFKARLLSDQRRWREAAETYDVLLRQFGDDGKWATLARHFKGRALDDEALRTSEFSDACSRLQGGQWVRLCAF